MQTITCKFPSTDFGGLELKHIADVESHRDDFLNHGKSGFVLIDDKLVPYSFIYRVYLAAEGNCQSCAYDTVYSVKEWIDEDLWKEFTDQEKKVIGPCLLILMEMGKIRLHFEEPPKSDSLNQPDSFEFWQTAENR
jgi:hypothetical protein